MDFKELIKSNQNNVRSIIKLITKETNEDLEQEVYVKVWKNADKYKEQGTLKSWINTIAKNVSKDYLKLTLISSDRQRIITEAVNSLKPKFKEVIMLCEIYGYTYEDAAYKLKCPVGTIKSRLYNAKKELALLLQDLL